jgi:hypothetical protein
MAISMQFFEYCRKVLQSPVFQFLMAIVAISVGKSMEKWAEAVAKYLPHIQWAMAVVAVVQSMLFVHKSMQHLKSIDKHMRAVGNTSQVCATRANLIEWRSCLAFTAKWHQCSLQGAYLLWQKGQSSVPACPASQVMLLETGQPMSQLDQFMADEEWPALRLQVLEIDSGLSVAHENFLLMTVAKKQFPPATQLNISKWEAIYKQWCQTAAETSNFDLAQYPNEVKKAVSEHSGSMQWDEPAFKFG